MPTFPSKPFSPNSQSKPSSNSSSRSSPLFNSLSVQVRKRPFLFFGLPFLSILVGGSFALSSLTQTRYEYNNTKVRSLSKEEELGMRKDRRRVDVREEYFRLQSNESELDDWEPKRIQRPEGVPEWGIPPTSTSSNKIRLDSSHPKSSKELEDERKFEEALEKPPTEDNRSPESTQSAPSSKKVILGPDGKPCRACNSKLAFNQAMRIGGAGGNGGATSLKGKQRAGDDTTSSTTSSSILMSNSGSNQVNSTASASICPPDSEELGRSTWTFLHSAVAYYPDQPTEVQKSSLLHLFKSLPNIYPCSHCAENLKEEYEAEKTSRGGYERRELTLEKAVVSGRFARIWLCGIHNEINSRLGKDLFDCSEDNLRKRWKDGDESC